MPIRLRVAQKPAPGLRIYRRLRYGRLAEFTMLDDRQYRTDNPCGDGESLRCDEALDRRLHDARPRAGALGGARLRASHRRAGTSSAQQLLIAELEHATDPAELVLERRLGRLSARAAAAAAATSSDAELRNPVFLTGDWHSTFVNDLKLDFKDPDAATVATEFVTPAITTGGDGTPYGPYYAPMIPFNPHIKYYEGDRARLLQGHGDAAAHAARPALRDHCRERRGHRLHREIVRRRRRSTRHRSVLTPFDSEEVASPPLPLIQAFLHAKCCTCHTPSSRDWQYSRDDSHGRPTRTRGHCAFRSRLGTAAPHRVG